MLIIGHFWSRNLSSPLAQKAPTKEIKIAKQGLYKVTNNEKDYT